MFRARAKRARRAATGRVAAVIRTSETAGARAEACRNGRRQAGEDGGSKRGAPQGHANTYYARADLGRHRTPAQYRLIRVALPDRRESRQKAEKANRLRSGGTRGEHSEGRELPKSRMVCAVAKWHGEQDEQGGRLPMRDAWRGFTGSAGRTESRRRKRWKRLTAIFDKAASLLA